MTPYSYRESLIIWPLSHHNAGVLAWSVIDRASFTIAFARTEAVAKHIVDALNHECPTQDEYNQDYE
jgi:hypothetical protein